MATYYWVGGSGTWDTTSTTNWSSSSGGSGGAGVPGITDNVIFDSASNATDYTVTVNDGDCNNITIGAPASGTLTFSIAANKTMDVRGNWTSPASNVAYSGTGQINIGASGTSNSITTNGGFVGINFAFLGGISLVDAFKQASTSSGAASFSISVPFSYSSLTTNNNAMVVGTFNINTTGSSFTLGSSTIDCQVLNTSNAATLTAGTSTFNVNGQGSSIDGSYTFYNVVFNINSASAAYVNITGATTYNNLTANFGSSSTNNAYLFLNNNITVNGTFTATGTAVNQRVFVGNAYYNTALAFMFYSPGTAVTLSAASASLTNVDFHGVTASGAATWSGTSVGNAGGNTGITFASPKTVYWSLAGGGTWQGNTGFAASSGGSPATSSYPLPQDTVIFENTGLNTSATVSANNSILSNIDCSTRTNAMTLSFPGGIIFGFKGTSSVSVTATSSSVYLAGGSFDPNGVSMPTARVVSGTTILASNYTGTTLSVYGGTLDANNKNVTLSSSFSIVTSTPNVNKTITMGSGTWTLSGTGTVWNAVSALVTLVAGTSTISMTNTSSTGKTFAGAGLSYNKLNIGGLGGSTATYTITGSSSFAEFNSTKNVATTIRFTAGTTNNIAKFTVAGSSGKLITIGSTTTSAFTLNYTGITNVSGADYLSISYSTATPANKWYAGANSTDGGNNSGWTFGVAPAVSSSNFFLFM